MKSVQLWSNEVDVCVFNDHWTVMWSLCAESSWVWSLEAHLKSCSHIKHFLRRAVCVCVRPPALLSSEARLQRVDKSVPPAQVEQQHRTPSASLIHTKVLCAASRRRQKRRPNPHFFFFFHYSQTNLLPLWQTILQRSEIFKETFSSVSSSVRSRP